MEENICVRQQTGHLLSFKSDTWYLVPCKFSSNWTRCSRAICCRMDGQSNALQLLGLPVVVSPLKASSWLFVWFVQGQEPSDPYSVQQSEVNLHNRQCFIPPRSPQQAYSPGMCPHGQPAVSNPIPCARLPSGDGGGGMYISSTATIVTKGMEMRIESCCVAVDFPPLAIGGDKSDECTSSSMFLV